MRPLGVFIAAASAAVALATVPFPGAAAADSVEDALEDVDRAEDEVGQAERDRARLERTISNLAVSRSQLQDQLLATLSEYSRRNAELEEVSYQVANLRSRVLTTEQEVGDLRTAVQQRAVVAYMQGSVQTNTILWSASSFHEAAVVVQAVQLSFQRDIDVLSNLAVTRRLLGSLREQFDGERLRLLAITDDLGSLKDDLERQFQTADSSLAAAYRDLGEVDRRYHSALSELEEAQRKLATFRGAGQWRPIVERYFRASLVEDAIWVMQCESRGNPDATNPISDAAGLYQFLPGTWTYASAGAGFAGASRYDPQANIAAAAWLAHRFQDRGSNPWTPWTCRP